MSELLQVTIHEASGLAGGFMGKKDPYVLMKLGGQSHHTTSIPDGGKNPSWEQTFSLTYRGEQYMEFCVMDKDRVGTDDLMGSGTLDLTAVRATKVYSTNVPITRSGKPAGTVRVTVALKSNIPGATGVPPPHPGMMPGYVAPGGAYGQQYSNYPPANQGYPPQPGYGYPAGQGPYAPGQGAYPPAQGGYAPGCQGAFHQPPQGGYPPAQGGYPPPPPQGGYHPHGGGAYSPQYPPQQGAGYSPAGAPPNQYAQGNYTQGGGVYPPPQPGYVPPGAYAGGAGYMPPHPPYPTR